MGEVSDVIFYENMYSDEFEEMVSMSNQALIRTDSGSFEWRDENPKVAKWETKIRGFSKTSEIREIKSNGNVHGFEIIIHEPNRRSQRSKTTNGKVSISIHLFDEDSDSSEAIHVMDKAINVSEDFHFCDGDLNACFESVIQNQGFLRKWISGESNKAEVFILLKIPGHTSVTKKIKLSKVLDFSLTKADFIHYEADKKDEPYRKHNIRGIKVQAAFTKLGSENGLSNSEINVENEPLVFDVDEWNSLNKFVRKKLSGINLTENDITPVVSFKEKKVSGVSKDSYAVVNAFFKPQIYSFEWTEPSKDGIGLQLKYYVGTLGQDLITQRLSEKHWNFIDSNQGVKWFPHTKDMGKEINRWVNSQNFSDNAIFSSDYQKFSIGSSTLKIEGKGMPPREPPANVYGSLDPRRRRPQLRHERELRKWKSRPIINAFFQYRYSNKQRKAAKEITRVNRPSVKDKKKKKRGRKLPNMNRNRIQNRRDD